MLNWKSATEVNNYGFYVERAGSNGVYYARVGFVLGHGNSNVPWPYTLTDIPGAGKFYYRLRQMDRDGNYKIYKTISVIVNAVQKLPGK